MPRRMFRKEPIRKAVVKAPPSCPHCIDIRDCASVDVCNAVASVCASDKVDKINIGGRQ